MSEDISTPLTSLLDVASDLLTELQPILAIAMGISLGIFLDESARKGGEEI